MILNSFVIQTNSLNFQFGKFQALKNVSLLVPEGAIYGFVGPNGAGKTTTIRTLLGLFPAQSGTIFIFGKDICKQRMEILQNVGAMVEAPSLYDHLNAKDNLEATRIILGLDKSRVNEVLEIVRLQDVAKKKVKTFSMGMKQRLALALALLSRPKLLILDEPTNGLDPFGIKEVRELLLHLNKEHGITIFLSSHILSEIEKLVTHIGMINKGALIFQGSLEELKMKDKQKSLEEIFFDLMDNNRKEEK